MDDANALQRRVVDDSPTYYVKHDWKEDAELSETIVEAVAEVTETDSKNLPVLFDVVDPESLDAIFKPTLKMPLRSGRGCLSFTFHACSVTVYWDGTIEIDPPSDYDD